MGILEQDAALDGDPVDGDPSPCNRPRDRLPPRSAGGMTMRRREFSAGLGSAAAWPVLASVQPERMRRIGALLGWTDGGPMSHPWLDAFIQELAHLGWVDGRNVRIVRLAPPARPFPQRGGVFPGSPGRRTGRRPLGAPRDELGLRQVVDQPHTPRGA